ncbi:MAG: cytochrome c [Candidatus Aminicenantes bacterium]|nr:MAG: cytochrome c [Candidatus Aminicenantes bacterium]
MSFFLIKSILALFLLATAVSAVISMFTIMGKAEKKADPKTLRKIHKISGRIFLLLLLPLIILGLRHWANVGDQASLRAVFHAVLALGLIVIFLLKVSIVKFYKQFLRFAPVLGMLVFSFAFVVFSISAGYYAVRTLSASPPQPEERQMDSPEIVGNADQGASFYNTNCLSCHHADSEEKKLGPGLKGLFKNEKLPHTGRPATVENVKQQLIRPALVMPSFTKLTEQEIADLIAYLKIL